MTSCYFVMLAYAITPEPVEGQSSSPDARLNKCHIVWLIIKLHEYHCIS